MDPFEVPEAILRERRSAKWTTFAPDVLPLPVAEMDVALAPAIAGALRQAVDRSDTGYHGDSAGLRTALAAFAARRYGWSPDPARMRTCPDVAVGMLEVLRRRTRPGDAVVVCPPIYPPFREWAREARLTRVDVPLDAARGWRLDLDGIERALGDGARAVLLCNPHNPTGTVHTRAELEALAALAARHDALVLADEIHAPLVHGPGAVFTPYLDVGEDARRTGVALHSASKGWNLAGLKCAVAVAADQHELLDELPDEVRWGTGHLGAIANEAAFTATDPWLDALRAALAARHAELTALLAEQVPAARVHPAQATFLAWVDVSQAGLGEDPAARLLAEGRVAVTGGPDFGLGGEGFVRINVACSSALLQAAVGRIAAVAAGRAAG